MHPAQQWLERHRTEFNSLYIHYSEWNSRINLSSLKSKEDVYAKHFLDSLLLLSFIDLSGLRVMDIGTGGGYPLLPLSIAVPSAEFVGIDARRKKINAVSSIIKSVQLSNVKVEWGRAEELSLESAHRERYDVVMARAVSSSFRELLEWSLPLLVSGGKFIVYEGQQPKFSEEASTLRSSYPIEVNTHCVEIEEYTRRFVIATKRS